jgi:hypothetical protein
MTQTALQKAAPKIASLPARLERVIRGVTSWAEGLEVKLKRLEELVR